MIIRLSAYYFISRYLDYVDTNAYLHTCINICLIWVSYIYQMEYKYEYLHRAMPHITPKKRKGKTELHTESLHYFPKAKKYNYSRVARSVRRARRGIRARAAAARIAAAAHWFPRGKKCIASRALLTGHDTRVTSSQPRPLAHFSHSPSLAL